ncbi:MAG: hypothetical protein M3384_17510, partial [Acidobacteriota bacterium]|nr:hypothetical protein [Acidobacteriota bacterium]
MINSFPRLLCLCLFLFLLSAVAAFGQTTQDTNNSADQTLRSGGRVNPSSLGMEMDIPLGTYKGRGTSLPLNLTYSSKLWRFDEERTHYLNNGTENVYVIAKYAENSAAGWTTGLSQPYIEYTGETNRFDQEGRPLPGEILGQGQQPVGNYFVKRITVHLPGGASHEMRAQDEPISIPLDRIPEESDWNATFYAVDGSGLKYVQNSNDEIYKLWLPDGSYYTFDLAREAKSSTDLTQVRRAVRLTDTHGNYVYFNIPSTNYPNGSWTDQLGRTFPIMIPREMPSLSANEPVFQQFFTLPGVSQPYVFRWKRLKGDTAAVSAFTDFNNQQLHYPGHTNISQIGGNPVNYSPSLFYYSYQMSPCSGNHLKVSVPFGEKFNPVVLSEIVLPNGTLYRFTYNEFGEIERIYYPTGGREEIEYEQVASLADLALPYQQTNRGVVERRIYENDNDATADTWTYAAAASTNNYRTSTIAPNGARTDRFMHRAAPPPQCTGSNYYMGTRFGYDNGLSGMTYEERIFSTGGQLLHRASTRWDITKVAVNGENYDTYAQRNPRIISTESIIYDGDPGLSAATRFEYDTDVNDAGSPLNVRKTINYAFKTTSGGTSFQPGELPPSAVVSLPDPTTSATVVKITETSYLNNINYRDRHLLKLPNQVVVRDAQNSPKAKSEIVYDEPSCLLTDMVSGAVPNWTDPETTVRGLPTTSRSWTNIAGNQYFEAHSEYDQFGNVRKTRDAMGNVNEIQYNDNFSDEINRHTYAFPTKSISPIPDPTGVHGSNTALITTTKYKFETGLQ